VENFMVGYCMSFMSLNPETVLQTDLQPAGWRNPSRTTVLSYNWSDALFFKCPFRILLKWTEAA